MTTEDATVRESMAYMTTLHTSNAKCRKWGVPGAVRLLMIGLSAFIASGCGAKTADDQAHKATGVAIQGGAEASGGGAIGGVAIQGGAVATGGAATTGYMRTAGGTQSSGGASVTGGSAFGGYANPLGGSQSTGGSAFTGGASSCKPKVCSDFGRCPCAVQLDGCGGEIDCGVCDACCPMDCEMLCAMPDVYCSATVDADSGAAAPCPFGDGCGGVLFCNCTAD